MPISYGQVKGFKYDTPQPIHDPQNPKPSRYAPQRSTVKVLPDISHGKYGYDRGCRCEICRKANRDAQRRKREKMKK